MIAINSKNDLHRLKGTSIYTMFVNHIAKQYEYTYDTQEYPENYFLEDGTRNPDVADLEPVMKTGYRDNLLEKWGLTKSDIGR